MTANNLGTKRQCPKCAAKFYDFGAVEPIACPKCKHTWKEGAAPKAKAPAKPKKEPPIKKVRPILDDPLAESDLPPDMEADEGDEIEELEPMEEEEAEMTSLDEVQEHEEKEDVDPNSDDAEDEMFTEMAGEEKLVDDLEDYIETDEDLEEDENEEE